MQANPNTSAPIRTETYMRSPDVFPAHSTNAGANLANTWRNAHQTAQAHDIEQGIVRLH